MSRKLLPLILKIKTFKSSQVYSNVRKISVKLTSSSGVSTHRIVNGGFKVENPKTKKIKNLEKKNNKVSLLL